MQAGIHSDPGSAAILVVDDHGPNRVLLQEILLSSGYTVMLAKDGEAALQQVKIEKPDLVILDVMMPRLNGFEVCARIKSDKETCLTPVILVTALFAKSDRIRGITAGADDFLTKPIDHTELLARVRSLLRLKKHTDELAGGICALCIGAEY
jgi:DNA-binding response OmpR family regulator